MDTVEGKKGGKVLLTMLFRNSKLMLAFLLEDKTRNSVLKVFNWIESIFGNDLFKRTFPVILTDNGTEFSNPLSLEFNHDGIARTRIFFCNPGASYQKGAIENNHNFIRKILPNGQSWNHLTQEKINLMFSHINSTPRENLGGKTPYEIFSFIYIEELAHKLNIQKIAKDEVTTTPRLLK